MREILFRGQNSFSFNWIEGSLLIKDETPDMIMTYTGNKHEVVPESVGQFTGLTDKNGTKVYEGDCLKSPSDDIIFEVKWRNAMFILSDKNGITRGINYPLIAFEVIGNIHENTELLK